MGVPGRGLRSYLAVRGGIAVPPVLGSRATDVLAGLGPDPLTPGALLPVGPAPARFPMLDVAPVAMCAADEIVLRVECGPRHDWFADDALATLVSRPYEVTPDSNRIGMRPDGPALERSRTEELPSEGIRRCAAGAAVGAPHAVPRRPPGDRRLPGDRGGHRGGRGQGGAGQASPANPLPVAKRRQSSLRIAGPQALPGPRDPRFVRCELRGRLSGCAVVSKKEQIGFNGRGWEISMTQPKAMSPEQARAAFTCLLTRSTGTASWPGSAPRSPTCGGTTSFRSWSAAASPGLAAAFEAHPSQRCGWRNRAFSTPQSRKAQPEDPRR